MKQTAISGYHLTYQVTIMIFTIPNNITVAKIMAKSGLIIKVVYICTSLLQLGVESRDLSQNEKKLLLLKADQIYKMADIFTQNNDFFHPVHFE